MTQPDPDDRGDDLCHGCSRRMTPSGTRFAIAVEVAASLGDRDRRLDLDATDEDPDRELAEILEQLRHRSPEELADAVWQKFTFALCAECKRQFLDLLRHRYRALKY